MDWQALLDGMAGLPYGGEAVDQLFHARQCAGLALDAGADVDLVVAALLHDVGRAKPVVGQFPGLPHELAGGRFCEDLLSARVAWLVAAHVPAKRYLVATGASYVDDLSPASLRSLERQGGALSVSEICAFAKHRWAEDALALRRWDEAAKDPEARAPTVDDLVALIDLVEW